MGLVVAAKEDGRRRDPRARAMPARAARDGRGHRIRPGMAGLLARKTSTPGGAKPWISVAVSIGSQNPSNADGDGDEGRPPWRSRA